MSDNRAAVAKLTKVDKAAVLLLSLGETDAAQVLRHMGPKEVQRVGVAMAQMRNVHREQVEQVMSEFVEIVGDQTSLGVGSDSYIRKMLTSALGEDKANGLIDRILLGGNTSGLDSLKWMEPRAVADVIRYEHRIDPAVLERLGEPFFTTKATGTGLGLAVVNAVVRAHQGQLHLRSRLGRGTCALISLPLVPGATEHN